MSAMDELSRVRADLSVGERTLDDLWNDRPLLWQGLAWNRAQLRLWLLSLPDIKARDAETDNPTYRRSIGETARSSAWSGASPNGGLGGDLGDVLVEVLTALGKPAPLALVRTKLPPGLVATEPMIRAAVQAHPRLRLTGPLIGLIH